jgi:hypothetical protein
LDLVKDEIYQSSLKDIRRILSVELSSKFFGIQKEVEVSLKEDPVVSKALEVLADKERYVAILHKKK